MFSFTVSAGSTTLSTLCQTGFIVVSGTGLMEGSWSQKMLKMVKVEYMHCEATMVRGVGVCPCEGRRWWERVASKKCACYEFLYMNWARI